MKDPLLTLQRSREAVAATLEARAQAFAYDLAQVWRDLTNRLATLIPAAAAGSTTAIIRAARAGQLKRQIERALEQAGWADLVDASTGGQLEALVAKVEALRLSANVAAFVSADTGKIEALKVLAGTDLLLEGDQVASSLWKATVQGVFSSRPTDQILDDLGSILDHSAPQVRTLYDTSISVFAREVENLSVPADEDRPYVYTGPSDEKVRPFCRQHLGKVYARAAIAQMDNGQLPNVFLTGGGYNCRHGWTAVSKFSDLATLAGTGKRVAAFAQGLDEEQAA